MADATRYPKIGEVVKSELWPGLRFCRKAVTVLVNADTVVGECLYDDAGTWTTVDLGNESSAAGILIDKDVYNYSDGDTPTLGVLVKGPAVVAEDALHMDSGATAATAITALEALDINVETSVG